MRTDLSQALENIFSLDLRSLALFRIGLALTLLFDLAVRLTDLRMFYSDGGVLPRASITADPRFGTNSSLFFVSGYASVQAALFAVAIAAAISLLIGYRTRLAILVSWVLLFSLHSRAPLVMQGDDVVRRVLLFWSLFLPLNARYSVDAALSGAASPTLHSTSSQRTATGVVSIGTVALFLQVAFIYWCSAVPKTSQVWHAAGTGLYYALNLDMYATPAAGFLLAQEALVRFMGHATVPLELCAPFLLFSPIQNSTCRLLAIALFVAFHLGIAIVFTIAIFSATCIVAWLAFLPSSFWQSLARLTQRRKAGQSQWHIYYDGDCGFCKRMLSLLQTFLALPPGIASPAQDAPGIWDDMQKRKSWIVTDSAGSRHYEFAALARLGTTAPLVGWIFRPATWPPFATIGNSAYRCVTAHRERLGGALAALKPEIPRIPLSGTAKVVAASCLLYSVGWNLRELRPARVTPFFPHRLDNIGLIFRLDQRWGMFAPYPILNDGWMVITGKLRDGTFVDLWRGTNHIDWAKPHRLGTSFKNYRWRQYIYQMASSGNTRFRADYARYLRRGWNRTHSASQQLISVSMYFVLEETRRDGEAKPFRVLLYRDRGQGAAATLLKETPAGNMPIGTNMPAAVLRRATPLAQETGSGAYVPSIPRSVVMDPRFRPNP